MKLIRQAKLSLVRASSEKLYEIDLCEVGDGAFVVNFRYGKRGKALQDGSMTPLPVPLREAESIFNKLRRSRLDKGYSDPDDPQASSSSASSGKPSQGRSQASRGASQRPANFTHSPQSRARHILSRLDAGETPGESWPLDRVILRAGDLGLKQAESAILKILSTSGDDQLRRYNCALALGQCGSEASVPALEELFADARNQASTRRMAAEALRALLPPAQASSFLAKQREQLPGDLARLAEHGPPEEFQAALAAQIEQNPKQGYAALCRSYLLDGPNTRDAVLELCLQSDRRGRSYAAQRELFKAAEYRGDGQLFGILLQRLALHSSGSRAGSEQSRQYFDRRGWRTLERSAQNDLESLAQAKKDAAPPERFVRLAIGVLACDGVQRLKARRLLHSKYVDAYAGLWDAAPRALVHLLHESGIESVHTFAVSSLRRNQAFLNDADLRLVLMLLNRPFAVTIELGLDLARARYNPAQPDLALLLALAQCAAEKARAQGHTWIDQNRRLVLEDAALLCQLATSPHADTRSYLLGMLKTSVLATDPAKALLGRLVAAVLSDSGLSADSVEDVAKLLLQQLRPHIRSIGIEVLKDMCQHANERVQALAGELLAAHEELARKVPNELLMQLLRANSPRVRATGMQLLGLMPRHDLSQRPELLFHLATSEHSDLRHAARPLIQTCASGHLQFTQSLGVLLCERLRFAADEAVHAFVFELMQQDLSRYLQSLDKAAVLQLVHSRFSHAQRLGSALLVSHARSAAWELAEIIRLARHEMRAVREQAFDLIKRNQSRIEQTLHKSTALLDAPWQDSRAFAMEFFRDRVRPDKLSAEVLVGICDSPRPEIQQFGRELITRSFEGKDGQAYLLALSEHPSEAMQLFASNYLERYASGDLARLAELLPFFKSVLCRVNRGAIAKLRVFQFMEREALKSEDAAQLLTPAFADVSLTIAVQNKARCIEAMLRITEAYPCVEMPLKLRPAAIKEPCHAL